MPSLFLASATFPVAARAQDAAPRSVPSFWPTQSLAAQPQMTPNAQPQSAIAPLSGAPTSARQRKTRTALVLSMPVLHPASENKITAPRMAAATPAPATNSASGNAPQKSASPRRIEVLAPATTRTDAARTDGVGVDSTLMVSRMPTESSNLALGAPSKLPTRDAMSGRSQAARLPSRGGPLLRDRTVELRPDAAREAAPMREAPVVSESQRLLLARLDADLGRAQKRLNRAESRLSEGQQQLGEFTGVLQSAMLEAGDDARGLHPFVRVAQRYLGTPYVWGGESARGFDCSGFIMRVMRDLGYRALPHSAAEQFRYGLPIAKPLLKAGDVVFFANTYKPGVSHVGIYLGRGRFIHAANSKVGTIVSSLSEPKWTEKYAGARRLLPVKS